MNLFTQPRFQACRAMQTLFPCQPVCGHVHEGGGRGGGGVPDQCKHAVPCCKQQQYAEEERHSLVQVPYHRGPSHPLAPARASRAAAPRLPPPVRHVPERQRRPWGTRQEYGGDAGSGGGGVTGAAGLQLSRHRPRNPVGEPQVTAVPRGLHLFSTGFHFMVKNHKGRGTVQEEGKGRGGGLFHIVQEP